jgi:tRNA(Ile)-lysidine synthase
VKPSDKGLVIPPDSTIEVRFRQGGESIVLRKQTKSLKKLFQEWKIPAWLRERTPLLYVDGQLAAVIGYAVSDYFYQKSGVCKAYDVALLDSLPD